ncbi:MAG: YgjV family protein [Clostridia bacterium]|nr:YgjV family protein [Clostridia bacterium]
MDSLLLLSYAELTAQGSPIWWIAQVLGIIGMVFNALSYQCKKQRGILTMQLISSCIFMTHFFLLGALTGAILNGISLFRAGVFRFRGKKWADNVLWPCLFICLSCLTYVFNFTIFKTTLFPNGVKIADYFIEVLPVIGLTITTFAMRARHASVARKLSLINSPFWLTYNLINISIAGILGEAFGIISIITGMIRLDFKKGKNVDEDLIYRDSALANDEVVKDSTNNA